MDNYDKVIIIKNIELIINNNDNTVKMKDLLKIDFDNKKKFFNKIPSFFTTITIINCIFSLIILSKLYKK